MITTIQTLAQARIRWQHVSGDMAAFDKVATVLDGAICHSDVKSLLNIPEYSVVSAGMTNPDRHHVWIVRVRGLVMLEYTLKEVGPDADVAIFL